MSIRNIIIIEDEPTGYIEIPQQNEVDLVHSEQEPTCGLCEQFKCKICFDQPVQTVLEPCMHAILCIECSQHYCGIKIGAALCIICNAKILQIKRVYFS
jgi:hypothetical protein